ncbi:MAG: hypothetical protein KF830_10195 [Planctomycetes bacterium]|nr:hypothetical protein [Planctomycetota bacterium]
MRRPLALLLPAATLGALALLPWPAPMPSTRGNSGAAAREAPAATLAALRFVPNMGQWHDEVRYAALGDTAGWLHDDGFTLRFERWDAAGAAEAGAAAGPREQLGCVVRTRFVGAEVPEFVPGPELEARQNFFLGRDPQGWRTQVPSFATVTMARVLPGIDVVFRPLPAGRRGPFEYDLLLAPGADLDRFIAVCEGVESLAIDGNGCLRARIRTPAGDAELVQEAPVAWQDTAAGRVPLRVAFRLLGTRRYGFVAADLDPAHPAVVDPGVVWGTFLGGGASDSVNDLCWRPGAGVWVGGWAGSTDFPTTVGAYRTTGGADAFVARLRDDGAALVYATYLGGSAGDEIRGVAVGPGETAVVVGFTASADFPVTPGAVQPAYGGAGPYMGIGDGFVVRLAANGAELVASTYLGGAGDDVAQDVAIDASGDAVVTGFTFSFNFPITPGAWRPIFSGFPDVWSEGFVTKVAANGQSLRYSTFVGGFDSEQLLAVDVDPVTGDAVVAGWTLSTNFPTTPNAYRQESAGDIEGVVVRLSPTGAPRFSTHLGGIAAESVHTARFAGDGSVWVGGRTNSVNFPVTLDAPQRTGGGAFDGFVSRLGANGQTLLFSTLLGGADNDSVRALAVGADRVVVVGEAGTGFPVTANALQAGFAGGSLDGFVAFLVQGGAVVEFASYLGGADQDMLTSVQVDDNGFAVVGGWTFAADFPLGEGGAQGAIGGAQDGVVVKLDLEAQLGDAFAVAAPAPAPPRLVAAGAHEVLATVVENLTGRAIEIEAVRLLVAGAGDAAQQVRALRAWLDLPGAPAPQLVAGPLDVLLDDAERELPFTGALLPPGATGVLRFEAELLAPASGRTVEVACALVGRDAWQLRAEGAGDGPQVRVLGSGRAEGGVLVRGAMPGDADGDGQQTVVDVRRLLQELGAEAPAIDCTGDGLVTTADVDLVRQAVLGRPGLVAAPDAVVAGGWFTLRGVFGRGLLEATLGGRVLTRGQVTPREITLRSEPTQAKGLQQLVVLLGGRPVFVGPVLVQ